MSRLPHTYSRATRDVLAILGAQITDARKRRGWTQGQLAERAGLGVKLLRDIERGEATPSIGAVFETAIILRIPLYTDDDDSRGDLRALAERHLTLLARSVRPGRPEPADDNF